MDRTILHCDLNSFYASVECLYNPKLKKVPMAVGGNVENRHGIILAKNELAKKCGVVTAETIWEAKKKCPNLILVEPRHEVYLKYSKIVNEIYNRFTDMVEPFGIDESWLDVTGSLNLFGSGKEIADKIRETIKKETGLTISVGVSFNKVFSKLGSDYKKPDATTVISKENYKDIVYTLPVSELLYVGKVATEALHKLNIKTIGELANYDRNIIINRLGKTGAMIHDYANGIDNSKVNFSHEYHAAKSIGNGMTFKRNLFGYDEINIGVLALSDTVATNLRKSGLKCNTVQVVIKDPNFKTISRQKKLSKITHLSKEISDAAMEIINSSWNFDFPIRMISITGTNLIEENKFEQINLFTQEDDIKRKETEKIEKTIDMIRSKFGQNSISYNANTLKNINVNDNKK